MGDKLPESLESLLSKLGFEKKPDLTSVSVQLISTLISQLHKILEVSEAALATAAGVEKIVGMSLGDVLEKIRAMGHDNVVLALFTCDNGYPAAATLYRLSNKEELNTMAIFYKEMQSALHAVHEEFHKDTDDSLSDDFHGLSQIFSKHIKEVS